MSSRPRNGSRSGSSGTIAVPPAGSAATTSAFACATFSTVPSSSRCTGPMLVITPMSGRAIAHSSAIWPSPRIPISQTTTSVSGSIRVSVSGSADLVVVPRLGGDRPRVRPAHRRQDVLRRRLARRAGDRDDPRRAARPHRAAERAPAPRMHPRAPTSRPPRARTRDAEVLAPADGEEEVALLDAPRVDLHPRHLVRPRRSVEPAGTKRGDLLERERDHVVAAPSLLRASRATSRSSKGTVRSRNC